MLCSLKRDEEDSRRDHRGHSALPTPRVSSSLHVEGSVSVKLWTDPRGDCTGGRISAASRICARSYRRPNGDSLQPKVDTGDRSSIFSSNRRNSGRRRTGSRLWAPREADSLLRGHLHFCIRQLRRYSAEGTCLVPAILS